MQPASDARPRRAAVDALLGRVLDGRYRIGDRIARGGMASVYEATDLRLDRTVAVKVMHPGLGDDAEFAARFVREARAAARLAHPHVVDVYDQGEEDGTVFLVMEYVPGHTLRDVVRAEAPMSPARALALLEPMLSALAAAHRSGLVHRDVKPENVLIAADRDGGRVMVADFGLAKAVGTDTQHTATGGVLIGTVSYLAPELVVDGRSDARADVYAAGVVLYEMLTGRKPHEGESPIQVAYKHVHQDVPPPSRLVPGIPAYVDALVARATARDRGRRPADAGVLLHQLHRVRQALADGVAEDPELTADLTPVLTHPDTGEPTMTAAAVATSVDTLEVPAVVSRTADATGPGEPMPSGPPRPAVQKTPGAEVAAAPPVGPTGAAEQAAGRGAGATSVGRSPGRRSWRGPLLLVLALLLAGSGGYAAWWFGVARYTSTPGVIGLARRAAQVQVEDAGLRVDFADRDYSETVPAGRVLGTSPEAGSRILDGGTVTVTLSLGKERYDVPRLAGMTEDRAQDTLMATRLTVGSPVARFSERVPVGRVIASDPAAGTTLRPGTAVSLVVSRGRRPIRFGNFSGRDADRAAAVLDRLGLEVERSEEFSDSVPEGRVIGQTPRSGPLFRGDSVSLVISRGPELVAVPQGLVASGVEAARAAVTAAGLVPEIHRHETYLGLGFVARVEPGSGVLAPKGSTVILYVV